MMAQKIREIMTPSLVTLSADQPVIEAAAVMKDYGIGDVIVVDGGQMRGIVTDRDLAVRVLADGRDPQTTTLGEVCSPSVVTVSPDDEVAEAVSLIRQKAVRRLPVVEGRTPVGIVSIGDLAIERDERSALAHVSAALPNT
jgi:CBS domain-containing protein